MLERPLEWMVDCGESTGHKVGRVASLAAAMVLFLFFLLSFQTFAIIGAVIFGILFAWMQSHANVEYEYCYFDGDVDVAAIYNRSSRKKKMNFTINDIEYIVKKIEKQEVTKYFCNRANLGSIYTIVMNKNGKRTAIVTELVPEFVKVLQMKQKVR